MKEEKFILKLPDLLYFVKESCHKNLHELLIELRDLADEAPSHHVPKSLRDYLKNFIREIQMHLNIEETSLFPSIEAGIVKNKTASIHHLVQDHDQMKIFLIIFWNLNILD